MRSCLRRSSGSPRRSRPLSHTKSKAAKHGGSRRNSNRRNRGLPSSSRHTSSPSKIALRTHASRYRITEGLEAPEHVPVPRNQLAGSLLQVGECPKPVVLQFPKERGIRECLAFACQGHWSEAGQVDQAAMIISLAAWT